MIAILSGVAFFVALAYGEVGIAVIALTIFCAAISESIIE